MKKSTSSIPPSAQIVADYTAALMNRDADKMNALRAPDFVLDWVHGDAFEDGPLSAEDTIRFWPAWFAGFPEMDYQVTRAIAATAVAVTQWTFMGTFSQPLGPPIFDEIRQPTGRTIRFRGATVYDLNGDGRIQRETTYLDLATLMVELGVTP
jgi:steroid delta-isomerase-like uncharacterized protein